MLSRRMFFTILRSTSWVMVTYSWISEIDQFFKAKNKPLRELSNPLLLADLAFLVDLHDHLNTLNKRLPGKDPHSPLALITLTVLTTVSITSTSWIVFAQRASWWMLQWNLKLHLRFHALSRKPWKSSLCPHLPLLESRYFSRYFCDFINDVRSNDFDFSVTWSFMSADNSAIRRVIVCLDKLMFLISSIFSGIKLLTTFIRHSLTNSPSENGLPCLAMRWATS